MTSGMVLQGLRCGLMNGYAIKMNILLLISQKCFTFVGDFWINLTKST